MPRSKKDLVEVITMRDLVGFYWAIADIERVSTEYVLYAESKRLS